MTEAMDKARLLVQALDVSVSNVFPSEADVETLGPQVDRIRARYEDLRRQGSFAEASLAVRAEFVAEALEEAERRALARCREIVSTARVGTGADAETLRRLLLAALDPRLDAAAAILDRKRPG